MDANTVRQSVRAKIPQAVACDLAEKRFKATDDIHLAVGALRELICTHEARGFLWRLRHPILNYRENSTIEDLTKRLKTEKGFDPEDIADAMNYPQDSFSMYWGKGLSNDHVTSLFINKNFENFSGKSTWGPIIKATQKLINKFYGEVNKTEALNKRMKAEMKEMQDELDGDMLSEADDLYKMDRDYLDRDDLKENEPKEEDPAEEFKKTSPRYAEERQKLHIEILEAFYSDFENVATKEVENPPEKKKDSVKGI
jgi:hypothetical protein